MRAFFIACTLVLIGWPWAPGVRADGEPAQSMAAPARGALERGRDIFVQTCIECHGDKTSRAPFIGDAASWKPRIDQGLQTLVRHALEGHGGPDGMPARGGFDELGNEDVAAAVSYLVQESQTLAPEAEHLVSACSGPQPSG